MQRVITHNSNNHAYITTRKPKETRQMWVYDEHSKTIKSYHMLSQKNSQDWSLDARGGHLRIYKTDSRWYQMWTFADTGHIHTSKSRESAHDYYAVVQSNVDAENRAVHRENNKKNEDYQKWDIVYVDEAPDTEKGFASEWGMHINRPFHIISEFGENRFLDLISNRAVIKTQNNRNSQVFRFDMKYRTIKVQGYSTEWSHSLDMRNQWMYVYGTGSQWH